MPPCMRDCAVAPTNATSTCAVKRTSLLTSLAGQSQSLQEGMSKLVTVAIFTLSVSFNTKWYLILILFFFLKDAERDMQRLLTLHKRKS